MYSWVNNVVFIVNMVTVTFTYNNKLMTSWPNGGITFNEAVPNNNFYKCCLPTSCSDPITNTITVNIFCKLIYSSLVCYCSLSIALEQCKTDKTTYSQV